MTDDRNDWTSPDDEREAAIKYLVENTDLVAQPGQGTRGHARNRSPTPAGHCEDDESGRMTQW